MGAELRQLLEEARGYDLLEPREVCSAADAGRAVDQLVERAASSGFNPITWLVSPKRGPEGDPASYETTFSPCGAACEKDLLAHPVEGSRERRLEVWAQFSFVGSRSPLEKHSDRAAARPIGEATPSRPCSSGAERFYTLNHAHWGSLELWRGTTVDLAARYDVSGVSFEDGFGCSGSSSHDELNSQLFELFPEGRGVRDLSWPRDALEGGRYHRLRVERKREVVASAAREPSGALGSAKPNLEISAATLVEGENGGRRGIDWAALGKGASSTTPPSRLAPPMRRVLTWTREVPSGLRGSRAKSIAIIDWGLRQRPVIDRVCRAPIVMGSEAEVSSSPGAAASTPPARGGVSEPPSNREVQL